MIYVRAKKVRCMSIQIIPGHYTRTYACKSHTHMYGCIHAHFHVSRDKLNVVERRVHELEQTSAKVGSMQQSSKAKIDKLKADLEEKNTLVRTQKFLCFFVYIQPNNCKLAGIHTCLIYAV